MDGLAANFCLFDSYGYGSVVGNSSSGFNYLDDLWLYNPSAGTWEWVTGSDMTGNGAVSGKRAARLRPQIRREISTTLSPGSIPPETCRFSGASSTARVISMICGYIRQSHRCDLVSGSWAHQRPHLSIAALHLGAREVSALRSIGKFVSL
jgi:hypothetical protein